MKAVVYTQYGPPDVLKLKEVVRPSPKESEVLIEVHAASVNAADWHLMRADPFLARFESGLLTPKNPILGNDIAGRVIDIGKNVTLFSPGDEVFGDIFNCGQGGFAEYVCADQEALLLKPASMTFEEAAAVPMAAVTALQGLRDYGNIQPWQRVLINGASGGVGTFAVQIAKSFDTEVTAVCSTDKMELVRSLGADHVIDYTKRGFTLNNQHYDLILAANGNASIWKYKRALTPSGIFVNSGGTFSQFLRSMLLGPLVTSFNHQKMGTFLAKPNRDDLAFVKELIEAGKVIPVIDRRYPLSQVADAVRYLEEGHARGKVIITIMHD